MRTLELQLRVLGGSVPYRPLEKNDDSAWGILCTVVFVFSLVVIVSSEGLGTAHAHIPFFVSMIGILWLSTKRFRRR